MWQNGKPVHLKEYLAVLKRNRSFVVVVMAVVFVFTFVINQWMDPVYSAQTKMLIEEKLQDVNLTKNMLLPYQKEFFDTQKEILESDPVFEATVLELKLHKDMPKPGWFAAIKSRIKGLLGLGFDMSEEQQKRDAIEKGISWLRKHVYVEGVRGTNILNIYVEGKDPEKSAQIANSLARQFENRSLYLKNKDSRDANDFLNKQVKEVQKKLLDAENNLGDFQFQEGAISLDKRIEFLVEKQLIVAEKEYEDVRLQLEEEREKIEVLHSQVTKERSKHSAGDRGNSRILNEEQLKLELTMKRLLRDFTEQHPDVVAVRKQLEMVKDRILQQQKSAVSGEQQSTNEFLQSLEKEFADAQRDYRVYAVRFAELKSHIERLKKKLEELLKKKSRFLVLKRELSANEKLYELLLKKTKEVGVESTLNVGHVKQIQEATLPVKPVKPRKTLNLMLSLIAGFCLGIGFAFLREYMNQTLRSKQEICSLMEGIPLVGVLQEEEILKKEKHLLPTIAWTNPDTLMGESFKILKANLQLFVDEGYKSILVTSSIPSEGKSTVASNLSIAMAVSGKRVLLMDCDLKKPKMDRMFQAKTEAHDGIYSTEVPGLFIWMPAKDKTAGTGPSSAAFLERFRALEKQYDFCVVDSAPLNLVADTSTLIAGRLPVLFVTGAGITTEAQIQRSLEILSNLESKPVGFVISRLEEYDIPKEYRSYYASYFTSSEQPKSRSEES
jgi:tyrosine-protein kinase Etk/Wzc